MRLPSLKTLALNARNVPLFALTGVVSLCIEAFAAGGILEVNTATVQIMGLTVHLAYAEAIMSVSMTLVALVLAGAAAAQKADQRPAQQARSGWTMLLSIAVLTAPIYYAGNCLAFQKQTADWREYHGSEAEAADRELANSPAVDSLVRAQAAANLRKGVRPERAEFDPASTIWIAFLLGCNMLAVRFGWRAKPETPAEARARLQALRAAKAKATRERNAKTKQRSNVTALFG